MIRIKHVHAANTKSCKDAVTGSAKAASVLKSKAAEYSNINIHDVRNADILNFSGKTANTVSSGKKNAKSVYVKTSKVSTHRVKCRTGRDNLTLDELFVTVQSSIKSDL